MRQNAVAPRPVPEPSSSASRDIKRSCGQYGAAKRPKLWLGRSGHLFSIQDKICVIKNSLKRLRAFKLGLRLERIN
jgi:hypothetical protein